MRLLIIKIIKYLVIPFGLIYEAVRGEKNEILILMYHRVNNHIRKELSVKEEDFKRQMEYLKRKNYKVITMDDAVRMIRNREIKGKYIVLTFDDGYEDFYTNAWPVLKQHGFLSTVYIVPGYVETSMIFPWDQDIGESRLMNWEQIIELNKSRLVNFGSHTQHHFDLDKLDERCVEYELETSKQIIEDKLGCEVRHFAYPRGIYAQSCERLVPDMYDTGVLISDGKALTNKLGINFLISLKRIPIQRSDGYLLFSARIKGWLIMEEFLRKIFSKYRKIVLFMIISSSGQYII